MEDAHMHIHTCTYARTRTHLNSLSGSLSLSSSLLHMYSDLEVFNDITKFSMSYYVIYRPSIHVELCNMWGYRSRSAGSYWPIFCVPEWTCSIPSEFDWQVWMQDQHSSFGRLTSTIGIEALSVPETMSSMNMMFTHQIATLFSHGFLCPLGSKHSQSRSI